MRENVLGALRQKVTRTPRLEGKTTLRPGEKIQIRGENKAAVLDCGGTKFYVVRNGGKAIIVEPLTGFTAEATTDNDFLLGRSNKIMRADFSQHDNISRKHAKIAVDRQGRVTIEELGSTNGTEADIVPTSDNLGKRTAPAQTREQVAFVIKEGSQHVSVAIENSLISSIVRFDENVRFFYGDLESKPRGHARVLPGRVLKSGKPLTFGRSEKNDAVSTHPGVSRNEHLTLYWFKEADLVVAKTGLNTNSTTFETANPRS